MFLDQEEINALEKEYGKPKNLDFGEIKMQEDEFELLKKSMEKGRAHDVTMFTFLDGKVVVIQKQAHPPKVYRAPGGGVNSSENIKEGIKREMYEETGLKIEIKSYVLRIKVTFTHEEEKRDWTSHVFKTERIAGKLDPQDKKEISEAKSVMPKELLEEIGEHMKKTGRGGLKYRAELTEAFFEEMKS